MQQLGTAVMDVLKNPDIAQVHVKPAGLNLNPGIGPYFYNLENFNPPFKEK